MSIFSTLAMSRFLAISRTSPTALKLASGSRPAAPCIVLTSRTICDSGAAGQSRRSSNLNASQSPDAAAELRAIVAEFDGSKPVEEALTLPSAWYTRRCVLEAEQRCVFGRNWQIACHANHVSRPGQFSTVDVGGEPLIVVRDETGKLHCHFNVCRHHAAIVEQRPEGCADHFRCPYHGFEYALDGRLRKATQLRGIKNFSAKSFGLVKAEVQEWGPFIFVRPVPSCGEDQHRDETTSSPSTFLQPLDSATRGVISQPKAQRFVHRRLYTVDCNWKVFVDNYLDGGFHVPHLHLELSKGLALKSYHTEIFPRCSLQTVGGKTAAAAVDAGQDRPHERTDSEAVDERLGTEAFFCYVYPNLMINRYGPWVDINIARPLGVDRCQILFEYYLDEDVAATKEESGGLDEFVTNCLLQSDQVQQEDIQISESVQRGLQSRSYDTGRYAPRVEHAMHDFHRTLAAEVAASLV
eukprot:scpid51533/ scgid22929/ Choline monooxygenase, chloroplastic